MSILDLPMEENDADASTIRDYLIALVSTLWEEKEGFSGKRPFGNSDWEYDLYKPLIAAGIVSGALDEWGYIERVDEKAADKLIFEAIQELTKAV